MLASRSATLAVSATMVSLRKAASLFTSPICSLRRASAPPKSLTSLSRADYAAVARAQLRLQICNFLSSRAELALQMPQAGLAVARA